MHSVVLASPDQVAAVSCLLDEYFTALQVVERDSPQELLRLLEGGNQRLWLACVDSQPAGCVAVRPLEESASRPSGPALECKRLYVRPQFRRQGIAEALMDELELFARRQATHWIFLDSLHTLVSAVQLYERRGYRPCPRYNDNPQATLFMCKRLD